MLIGLKYHALDGISDQNLLLDGPLEEMESAFSLFEFIVVENVEESLLFLGRCVSFLHFIFVAGKFLNKLDFPQLWEGLQLLKDLVKVLVQKSELQEGIIHGQVFNKD